MEKYSSDNPLWAFGMLINAMDGGGDRGQSFPRSDAEDLSCGARFIPGEATLARRRGETVQFIRNCAPCCWHWLFPDGKRIFHFDPDSYAEIRKQNGASEDEKAGPCPKCGNPHTSGGTVAKDSEPA